MSRGPGMSLGAGESSPQECSRGIARMLMEAQSVACSPMFAGAGEMRRKRGISASSVACMFGGCSRP